MQLSITGREEVKGHLLQELKGYSGDLLFTRKHAGMTDFHPCRAHCQVVYFLPQHPSLTPEPGPFLKIYGEIVPGSCAVILRGFPHYWITGGL